MEEDAVIFNGESKSFFNPSASILVVVACSCGEVNVDCWPRLCSSPGGEEECTLKYEAICQRMETEPVEKSLHRKVLQQFLKRAVLPLRLIQ